MSNIMWTIIVAYLLITIPVMIVILKEEVFSLPLWLNIPASFVYALFFPLFLLIILSLYVDSLCQKWRIFKEKHELCAVFELLGYDERNVLVYENKFRMKGYSISRLQRNFSSYFEKEMKGRDFNLVTVETNIFCYKTFRGRSYRACSIKEGKLFHCDRNGPFKGEFFQ